MVNIDGKVLLYGLVIALLVVLVLTVLGVISLGKPVASNAGRSISGENDGIPEECNLPTGQDLASWKEHLGHHTETRGCLKYFE